MCWEFWRYVPLWCHKGQREKSSRLVGASQPYFHSHHFTRKLKLFRKSVKWKEVKMQNLSPANRGLMAVVLYVFLFVTNISRLEIYQHSVRPLSQLEVVHLTNAGTDLYSLLKAERREDERDNWIRWDCLCCNLVYSKCAAFKTAKLIMAQRLELGSHKKRCGDILVTMTNLKSEVNTLTVTDLTVYHAGVTITAGTQKDVDMMGTALSLLAS